MLSSAPMGLEDLYRAFNPKFDATKLWIDVSFLFPPILISESSPLTYRAEKKSWYVVARNLFLLLLNFSAWLCLGAA